MKGKNNDASYSVIPFSTFCVIVYYHMSLGGCQRNGDVLLMTIIHIDQFGSCGRTLCSAETNT